READEEIRSSSEAAASANGSWGAPVRVGHRQANWKRVTFSGYSFFVLLIIKFLSSKSFCENVRFVNQNVQLFNSLIIYQRFFMKSSINTGV
ncbi:hypothetical protein JOC86_004937, partial [Bacillus pakistanensis]